MYPKLKQVSSLALFVFLYLLLTTPAVASENPYGKGNKSGIIENEDADGDGRVSQEEFQGPDRVFSKLDQNGDGYIDEDEARKKPRRKPFKNLATFMEDLDADNDGRVSKDEFQGPERFFSKLDQDEDGYIDEEELANAPRKKGRPKS